MCRGTAARQRGAALLALILLIVAGSAWMLLENLNATAIQNQRDEHDARVLAEAKDALIAYALTHSDINSAGEFGFLPCPDTGVDALDEGISHWHCGMGDEKYKNVLGKLPWKSLGTQTLRDSSGECLWYLVSGQYKNGAKQGDLLNSDTNGSFEIYSSSDGDLIVGAGPDDKYENRPVAVIIAPGEPVGEQNRTETDPDDTPECGGNYDPENYLDDWSFGSDPGDVENFSVAAEDDIDILVSGGKSNKEIINDKLVIITKGDIWQAVNKRKDIDYQDHPDAAEFKRLTAWVSGCLAEYAEETGSDPANNSLPYPAAPNLINDIDIRDYRDNALYRSIDPAALDDYYVDSYSNAPLFGRLPYDIKNSSDIKQMSMSDNSYIGNCDLSDSDLVEDEVKEGNEKYRKMWQNWKDHFFYMVADLYSPKSTWERVPDPDNAMTDFCDSLPRADWPLWWNDFLEGYCDYYFDNNPSATIPRTCGSENCISVDDNSGPYFAAVIVFSGKPHKYGSCNIDPDGVGLYVAQRRYNISYDLEKSESNDDRRRVCNYLEVPNLPILVNWQNERITYLDTIGDDSIVLQTPAVLYDEEHNDIFYCLHASPEPGVTRITDITECF
ncbi:hypothetical protein J2T55_002459 [Methylohalomonas lacus]|uniref:Type II secretion system protein n=1 Tax=Methylohalomonas lacus TaxID=398773 RepID=A0AAE3HPF5_9GAMM|nr:hypothetical protein [Methylohalomonas lacus]MCS3904423.1 hypothetical protein [Methylohalomonas lacus]